MHKETAATNKGRNAIVGRGPLAASCFRRASERLVLGVFLMSFRSPLCRRGIQVRVTRLIEAGASSSNVVTRVTNAINYWNGVGNFGFVLAWDRSGSNGGIVDIHACQSVCTPDYFNDEFHSLWDLDNNNVGLTLSKLPTRTGIDMLFVQSITANTTIKAGTVPLPDNPDGSKHFSNIVGIRSDNTEAVAFYRKLGYLQEERLNFGRRLIPDDAQPTVPADVAEPGR